MPLDPELEPLVAAMQAQAAEAPPVTEQTPAQMREGYRALATLVGTGPDVEVTDRSVPGPAGEIGVRIYRPGADAPGALVYLHGGGWVIGDLDTHDHLCRSLADAGGFVVVSVDYRLAPEDPWPAAVEDAWAALRWVAGNLPELGAGPAVAVGGDSAGGNLAAVMALRARDRSDWDGPPLAHQLLIYPSVDLTLSHPSIEANAQAPVLTRDHMVWFRGHYVPDPSLWRHPEVSPLHADSHAGLAPATVIVAELDPLHDEGVAYARALSDAGVPVDLLDYPGMIHVFAQLAPFVSAGADAVRRSAANVAAALAG